VRLLEAVLWTPEGGFALLDRHFDRLLASANRFAYDCDLEAIAGMLETAVADLRGSAAVRVLLSRDGAITCEAADLTDPPARPLRVALAADPIDPSDVFLYHKTTRRDVYDRARVSRPDADAVVLWNQAGEITEGTDANIVAEIEGRKVTPPVDCGLLPGTLRAALLERGEIAEQRLTVAALRACPEFWLISAVRGWIRCGPLL
jgi:para-aminobenzoate synthetase/4-amino-4-deoxychorismate lyase